MGTTAQFPFRDPERTHNFWPDRLCVVVTPTGSGSDALAQREEVRQTLNAYIRKQLLAPPSAGTPLGKDLEPTPVLWAEFEHDPVNGPLDNNLPENLTSSFAFARSGGSTTALHFFHVNLKYLGSAGAYWIEKRKRAKTIRELVKIVNGPGPNSPMISGDFTLVAVTPDWFTVMADNDDAHGSPGTPPDPFVPADEPMPTPFHFSDPAVQSLVHGQRMIGPKKSGVLVAVVDTCMHDDTPVRAAARQFGANELLQQVINPTNPVLINNPPTILPAMDDYVPNYKGRLQPWYDGTASRQEFATPDHGLFVAGIIKDIAPEAEIHLVRGLDDVGMGDLQALAQLFDGLMRWRRNDHPGHLILNLSLTADVPGDGEMVPDWFPFSAQDANTLNNQGVVIDGILDSTHKSLRVVMEWLDEQDVLVVAAAGNNALGNPPTGNGKFGTGRRRPEPGVPARYPQCVSVAAINREGQASSFSNEAEEPPATFGIATLGGDARLVGGPHPGPEVINKPIGGGKRDAVRGIISAIDVPFNPTNATVLGRGSNQTGWAYWSGTSFATPIISALAADLWAANPGWDRARVLKELLLFAKVNIGELNCGAIMADQEG